VKRPPIHRDKNNNSVIVCHVVTLLSTHIHQIKAKRKNSKKVKTKNEQIKVVIMLINIEQKLSLSAIMFS
jgi:hypothetical protein